jgi:uncharacterized NAD(P)/FAD-binding protein YdhS
MTALGSDHPPTIAIIGGGFSGCMVAVHLLRSATVPITVKLIERDPAAGLGVAYGTREDCHWLNVPASKMSAFPDDAGHFLHWLKSHGDPLLAADSFVPRKRYGAYLQAILQEAEAEAPRLARLERLQDEAIALLPDQEGSRIQLRSGRTLHVNRIVLAVGHFPPSDPVVADSSFYRNSRYRSDPWSPAALRDIDPLDSVLLIGSGLTAVDLVLALQARSYQGVIHLISRHGLLPQSHRLSAPYPPFLAIADVSSTLRVLMRRIRQEIDLAARQGYDWRAVIDALRPQTPVLWQALTPVEKQRFLRHLRPYWDNHRHRIAPEVAATIDRLQQSGQLQVHAGCIRSYNERDEGIDVSYKPRHQPELHALWVNWVINCTGPECNYRKLPHPLMVNLLATGLARPDALALGLEVDANGALVSATGVTSRQFYTLGPPQKGRLWETIAVPELREQAQSLARHLLQSLRPRTAPALSDIEGVV